MLNDTSIAAAITLNGDRNLFFQDHTGAIRQATREASRGTWIELGSPVPSGARLHTPLAIVYSTVDGKDEVSRHIAGNAGRAEADIRSDDTNSAPCIISTTMIPLCL